MVEGGLSPSEGGVRLALGTGKEQHRSESCCFQASLSLLVVSVCSWGDQGTKRASKKKVSWVPAANFL
jgi:hypothetical protein